MNRLQDDNKYSQKKFTSTCTVKRDISLLTPDTQLVLQRNSYRLA